MASRLLAGFAALLGFGPALAYDEAPPAPSLSVDQAFAPSAGGIARDGAAGTGTDIPSGVAAHGDRIYTVGEANGEVAIVARQSSGALATGFSGDGRVDIAIGNGKDVGMSIVVLPDGRLRVLAEYDADTTNSTNLDIAVLGLNADGSHDASFGGGDGRVMFPIGSDTPPDGPDDEASRLIVDEAGRLAITGWRKDANGKEDLFVARLEADGSPTTAFDGDGIRIIDRAGANRNDRGIDLAWRPGGGLVVLAQVATDPDTNVNHYIAALRALTPTGADDASFSDDGDVELTVGQPNTIPGGLIAYDGRLWVTGSTKVGTDTDAFLARLAMDGTGLSSRLFDMRGSQIAADQVVVSGGGDLDVLPGAAPTLVVVGSTTYNSRTFWSAAAFNNFEGDLAQAGFGDVLIPTDEYGALLGVQAGDGALAVTGSLLNVNGNFDTSFGTLRLLVDAEKKCDLAIDVPEPLEAEFRGNAPAAITIRVTNEGTRACAGEITVPAPYELRMGGARGRTLSTGPILPGAAFTTNGAQLAYGGPRRADDTIAIKVTAAGDSSEQNDTKLLHLLFRYCDLALRATTKGGMLPDEGSRRFAFTLRNVGTARCRRVRVEARSGVRNAGSPDRFTLAAGRSVSEQISAALADPARAGTKVRLAFRALGARDVDASNDTVRLSGRVVRVGDSRIAGAGSRAVRGSATGGWTPRAGRERLRLRGVEVAIRRLGGGCRWLASADGRFRTVGGKCKRPADWVAASGTSSWRLQLQRALPPGRYVAYSRVRTRAGFREGRFSAGDGNLLRFTVG